MMATEKRLIDANDLLRRENEAYRVSIGRGPIFEIIHRAIQKLLSGCPTVDAVEVVHGRWIPTECGTMCSACHREYDNDFEIRRSVCIGLKICPDCGAKMDKEENK